MLTFFNTVVYFYSIPVEMCWGYCSKWI